MKMYIVIAYYLREYGAHSESEEWVAGVANTLNEAKEIEKKALAFLNEEYKEELEEEEQNDGLDDLYKDSFYVDTYINEFEVDKFYDEKENGELKSL